ncbi:hypothetical protein E2I00_008037 [Balaenoptera physalus]|uniref:Vomeronasal type-1 receptor n=1 Tax=Balaenoptera physalus TaxID=9770 RepID=A0A643CEX6_BALPH|nr:hypothetical protein E2I00_008037 [Balaenoptera physalus]
MFLSHTGAGFLENSSCLCLHNFTLLTSYKLRPTDQTVNQLILANNLIPQTMTTFGLKHFLYDLGCTFVLVTTGVSLGTTCLLSGFLAIKFCPRTSWWIDFRIQSPQMHWLLYFPFLLLVNVYIPMNVIGPGNSTYVHVRQKSRLITCIHILSPGCYLGFKIWTSGYMIFVLHRYKQRAQYNHSNRLYPRPPHVATATCTIFILSLCYCNCKCRPVADGNICATSSGFPSFQPLCAHQQ